jgi:hypothetical protein
MLRFRNRKCRRRLQSRCLIGVNQLTMAHHAWLELVPQEGVAVALPIIRGSSFRRTMRVGGNKKGAVTRDRQPKAAAHALRQRWGADLRRTQVTPTRCP